MSKHKAGATRGVAVAALLTGVCALLTSAASAAGTRPWPSQVVAQYRLSFNGFEVGIYKFSLHYDGKAYSATGKAEVSALFGAFTWNGNLAGSGTVANSAPRPASFDMSVKSNSKVSSVKLGFDGDGVSTIDLAPKKKTPREAVKLKPEDLKNVFDPISATLAISDATPADACNRTIPVFDGKARYDLRLSFKGREPLKERHASGQPAELVVCRVKYVPIAGHKPKDFVNPWIDYDNIEIALRAVPSAGIYVPYRITVPSTIGPAVMTADTVNITGADNQQIALKQ